MVVKVKNKTMVREGDNLTTEIVDLVAETTDTEQNALPILYDTIDIETLVHLWTSTNGPLTVDFEYAGCEIRFGGDGSLLVTEVDD